MDWFSESGKIAVAIIGEFSGWLTRLRLWWKGPNCHAQITVWPWVERGIEVSNSYCPALLLET